MATLNKFIRVSSVIVTFSPDPVVLNRVLRSVGPQVDHIVIVHNGGPTNLSGVFPHSKTETVIMDGNKGIGAAQNAGIEKAKRYGATHVLLLDQDSIPSGDMVFKLVNSIRIMESQNKKPAAVGPRLIDSRDGLDQPFIIFKPFTSIKRSCEIGKNPAYIRTDFLIASGTLIPLYVIGLVGRMDENLFIDNVDMEWCLRARRKGYSLFGVCNARLEHAIGDRVIRLWFGEPFNIYTHTALRQYYIIRNSILLYWRRDTPCDWIFGDIFRLMLKTVFLLAFCEDKFGHLKMTFKGVIDGLRGKSGKYEL